MEHVPMARSSAATGRIMKAIHELGTFNWDVVAKIVDEALVEHAQAVNLENGELKKQLRTAQDVIQKHVADQVEGLHCVDCAALDDESCDCPMLIPIFEAMKGYLPPTIEDLLGECRECNRLVRDCGGHVPIPSTTESRKCLYNHEDHTITGFLPIQNCPNCA